MTPKYAAPELFGGKPGRNSDQYSLAIVYCEMLTGQLPFSGNNMASLASQHLYAAPDLSALSPHERFAVGKALSKDPEHRFASCRAFVERLMHRNASMMTPVAPTTAASETASRTAAAAEKPACSTGEQNCHDGHTIQAAAPEIRSLPRLLPPETPIAYRPVVMIGIGGTGGSVLCKLRQLVGDRIADAKGLPSIQFLYIDTDEDSLGSVVAGPGREGLTRDEILIAPLRQTQDYRSSVVSNLDSLSRRWIYNVPRSLRTQGLRALGRIAFVDHAERLLNRMRRAVTLCAEADSIAATTQHSGLKFSESDPRVFVIASLGGGTGGGMVIDAGYAIRQALAECGFTDEHVCGILTFPTSPVAGTSGVAPANTLACLEELRYFAQPGCDYPGEPACGLAGFRENGPTFPSTYVFEVSGPNMAGAHAATLDLLAEYLFASMISPSSALFDECRRQERETPSVDGLRLRTAGICSLAAGANEDLAPFAERLCRLLVRKWKVGVSCALDQEGKALAEFDRLYKPQDSRAEVSGAINQLGQAEMERIGVNLLALRRRIVAAMTGKLGLDPRMFLRKVIHDLLGTANPGNLSTAAETAVRRLRAVVGGEADASVQRAGTSQSLNDLLRPQVRTIGLQVGESVANWILQLADAGSSCLADARRAAKWAEEFVEALQQAAGEHAQSARRDAESKARSLAAPDGQLRPSTREAVAEALFEFAESQLSALVHDRIGAALRSVNPLVITAADQLGETWKDLTQLAVRFEAVDTVTPSPPANSGMSHCQDVAGAPRIAGVFEQQKRTLLEELDRTIEQQYFKNDHRLRRILAGGGHVREELACQMRLSARKIVLRAYHQSVHRFFNEAFQNAEGNMLAELLRRGLQTARPDLLDLGGAKRLLANIPKQVDVVSMAREIEQIAEDRISVSIEQDGDVQLCYEIEELPWEGIQTKLIRQRHDCRDLARRLHTRINVDWTVF
jgi:hypothetical protein